MDCRFFAMFAVGGSLLSSLLCFVEVLIRSDNSLETHDYFFFFRFKKIIQILKDIVILLQGFSLIVESYFRYFHSLAQGSEQEHLVHLVIEAMGIIL